MKTYEIQIVNARYTIIFSGCPGLVVSAIKHMEYQKDRIHLLRRCCALWYWERTPPFKDPRPNEITTRGAQPTMAFGKERA